MEFITSSRFSKEEEEEEQEEACKHEIPFMTTTSTTATCVSSSAGSVPVPVSASASGCSTTPFRSGDEAGASGSGGGGEAEVVEKEHMFDKVVTPSDVGKLNRLVIPKQYAEKYFPLDATANEKGLLLSFEDRAGKPWRFRYSYWNSSQSYVMTKGWSRFVKEKRLDAGDTVSFCRGAGEAARHRLFIDWKRRVDVRDPHRLPRLPLPLPIGSPYSQWGLGAATGGFFIPPSPPATLYEHRLRQGLDFRNVNHAVGRQLLFFGTSSRLAPHVPLLSPSPLHITMQPSTGVAAGPPVILDSVPVIDGPTTATKRVRLFGVNLDNPNSDTGGESSHDGNALSLQMPGWRPRPPQLGLLELPPHGATGVAESSAASSPSSSASSKREAHSSLDLDL